MKHRNPSFSAIKSRLSVWMIVCALTLLLAAAAVPASASQLFFTSADGCARSIVGFDSAALSSGATLQARVSTVMSHLDSTVAPALSCPAVSAASALPRIEGAVSFDFARQRLFDISTSYVFSPSGLLPSGSASFASALRITDYSSAAASQVSLALDSSDDVIAMQFQPSSGKIIAIIRNQAPVTPTLALFRLDPAGVSGAIKTQLTDLAATLGSASVVSGLSALDPAGSQRLLFATMVCSAGSAPLFSIVSLDLTSLLVTSHSLGASQSALEGMAWIPQLSSLLLVSYEGAALYNPTTQIRSPLSSVSSALSAISAASPSSLQAAAYLSAHLWQAVSSTAPVGSTPLAYEDLMPSGLISLLVQSNSAVAPLLLLIDAVANTVRIEAAPRSRSSSAAATVNGGFSTVAADLIGVHTLASTPTIAAVTPRTNLSAAGGDAMTISGTQLYSLPLLAGAAVQCEWTEVSGLIRQVAGTLLSSTAVRCVLPAIPRPNALLQLSMRVANESLSLAEIDVNQCLASNGGCASPSLCVHSYGVNSCKFITCTDPANAACVCLAGYTSAAATIDSCDACAPSTFKDATGFQSCSQCPAFASSAAATSASTGCSCVSGFQSAGSGASLVCSLPDTQAKNLPVLVTLSVQSRWLPGAVPVAGAPTTAVARASFIEQFRSDIATALHINVARISVSSVIEDSSAAALNLTAHSASGFAFVLVTFQIQVPTGGDSVHDSTGADYSSTLLLTFLNLMLAEPHSQVYRGVYTDSARADSLVALNGDEYHGSLPWARTTTGTAVLFFSCVGVLLLLVLWLVRASPPSARAFDLATLVLAVTSTVTNALFIRWLHARRDQMAGFEAAYWLSVACMALPPVPIAVITVVQIVRQSAVAEPCGVVRDRDGSNGKRNSRAEKPGPVRTLHEWMSDHTNVIVLACLLSVATSIDCLAIITSRILWKPALSAPWSQCVKFTTNVGLISVLFRSAPQLVVQVWVTHATDNWSNLQVLSIAASGMTVLVGLLVRGLTICLAKSVPVAQAPVQQQIQILPRGPKISERWEGALQAVTAGGMANGPASPSAARGVGGVSRESGDHGSAVHGPQVTAGRVLGQRPPVVVRLASIVALSIALLTAQGATMTQAALSSGPAGHVLSSSLQVFGNVTLVDGAGATKNLLEIIQRQEALLTQQAAALAAQSALLAQHAARVSALENRQKSAAKLGSSGPFGSTTSTQISGLSVPWTAGAPGSLIALQVSLTSVRMAGNGHCYVRPGYPVGIEMDASSPSTMVLSGYGDYISQATTFVLKVSAATQPGTVLSIRVEYNCDGATNFNAYDGGMVTWSL